MHTLENTLENYLSFCKNQKCLDEKTIKAYKIDLHQFQKSLNTFSLSMINPSLLEKYICHLHQTYKPKTAKRKIASVKAFFHYLEYKDYIAQNPFSKIQIKFREPVILPKTIPLNTIELFLSTMYTKMSYAPNEYQRRNTLRDIAVIELLFATGMRISEICSLSPSDINLVNRTILIYGKGAKERILQIGHDAVYQILCKYSHEYQNEIRKTGFFFINHHGTPLSDQSVRRMIRKYTDIASISLHITPHMFRHTFATALLDADVDIRYIQEMLGHSSINITEIYTHVTSAKQMSILSTKHPRKNFRLLPND